MPKTSYTVHTNLSTYLPNQLPDVPEPEEDTEPN